MDIINFLKKTLFLYKTAEFKEINGEFLERKKIEHSKDNSYLGWLKNTYGKLQAQMLMTKEKTNTVPAEWHDKIKLIEDAIEKEKNHNR